MRPSFKTFLLIALIAFAATAAQAAKVDVCHIPPGNPDNWHTISVSTNALNAHLNHGDLEGTCLSNCEALCDDGDACTQNVESDLDACICLSEPTPVNCDDSNPCTADSCSSVAGACTYDTAVLDGTTCDDGDASTDNDVCTAGVCAGTSAPTSWCDPNPCVDPDAVCVDNGDGTGFCDCPRGGNTGEFCEIPPAVTCETVGCNGRGECVDLGEGFVCLCDPGVSGEFCEICPGC